MINFVNIEHIVLFAGRRTTVLKAILFTLLNGNGAAHGQNGDFSLSAAAHYSGKTLHLAAPTVNLHVNRHAFYMGLDGLCILKPLGEPVAAYERFSYGINLGYANTFYSTGKWSIFFRLHSAWYTYRFHDAALFQTAQRRKAIFENSLSIGASRALTDRISVFTGAGINAFFGFARALESVSGTCYAGVDYRF